LFSSSVWIHAAIASSSLGNHNKNNNENDENQDENNGAVARVSKGLGHNSKLQ
jgi:hypothetical protein